MDIDYARAWLSLKEVVLSQRSHGQDGLLGHMARIELECRVPEGQEGLSDLPALRAPASVSPAKPGSGNGNKLATTH